MSNNILQSVSGGFDSTYLLIKNLQNGDNVFPIYIHVNCIDPIKQIIESTVIKSIIEKLKPRFNNLHELIEIEMGIDNIRDIFSSQPVFWILGLFNEVKNRKNYADYDEVHIGYIMQDSALSYLKEIKTYWKAMFSFSIQKYSVPKLVFPLTKYHKVMIINELYRYDSDILSSCWTCERPVMHRAKKKTDNTIETYIEPCGICDPCLKFKTPKGNYFEPIRNYKAVINLNNFYDAIKSKLKMSITSDNIMHIPLKFITLEEIDNQTFRKNIRKINNGKTCFKKKETEALIETVNQVFDK